MNPIDNQTTLPLFICRVYARTSTHAQAEEDKISIPDQINWAEELCKERGWKFDGNYVDELPGDVEFDKRPAGKQLLEDARNKQFNLLLVYHSSRLARETWIGLKVISDLSKNKIQTFIRNVPVEPTDPSKFVIAHMGSEISNAFSLVSDKQENVARSERVTAGFKNLAQRGVMVFAPYGFKKAPRIDISSDGKQSYSWSYEIDPTKSIVVARIFESYIKGMSLRKVVSGLIADNIPSPSGKVGYGSWSPATVKNILSNPAYIGMLRWGKKLGSKYREGRGDSGKQKRLYTRSDQWLLVQAKNCPTIVEKQLFMKVQDRLRVRGKATGRQLSSDSLLVGIVYCGACQRKAYAKTRKAKIDGKIYIRTDFIDQSYFRGLNCRRHLMAATKLEELVLLQLQTRLNQLNKIDLEDVLSTQGANTAELTGVAVSRIHRQLRVVNLKKLRLTDIYLNGSLTREEYSMQKVRLNDEEHLLNAESIRLLNIANDNQKKADALLTLKRLLSMFSEITDQKRKKEMLQTIVDSVIIFDDHIEIIYRYASDDTHESNVNPCPCGYLGDKSHECKCTQSQILRYQKKVSGPILDRIDIHLDVQAVKVEKLTEKQGVASETSKEIQARVQKARDRQKARFDGTKITCNAEISSKDIKVYCALSDECRELLKLAVTKLNLSGRSYHRTIKLARTIADLAEEPEITKEHIAEALQYRPKLEAV